MVNKIMESLLLSVELQVPKMRFYLGLFGWFEGDGRGDPIRFLHPYPVVDICLCQRHLKPFKLFL